MNVAYADPPYIGQARKHYKTDLKCAEVDHAALIAQLERDYDGWALSLSAPSLFDIAAMVKGLADSGVIRDRSRMRVLIWGKSFVAWKKLNPIYAYEPVLVALPRKSLQPSTPDFFVCHISQRSSKRQPEQVHGRKPPQFYYWLFAAMNLRCDDTLDDKYPGSGAASLAWEVFRKQAPPSAQAPRRKRVKQATLWEGAGA